jgi:hypothetical protein
MLMTEAEILNATEEQLASVSNEDLASALMNAIRIEPRRRIMEEVQRRNAARDLARPFDPRVDISADAQFLWKRIFIWFWVVPLILGLIAFVLTHA